MLLIALLSVWILVAVPTGIVAGIRQARFNAKKAGRLKKRNETPTAPLITALAGGVGWAPWLVVWLLTESCKRSNDQIKKWAEVDKIVSATKVASLERAAGLMPPDDAPMIGGTRSSGPPPAGLPPLDSTYGGRLAPLSKRASSMTPNDIAREVRELQRARRENLGDPSGLDGFTSDLTIPPCPPHWSKYHKSWVSPVDLADEE